MVVRYPLSSKMPPMSSMSSGVSLYGSGMPAWAATRSHRAAPGKAKLGEVIARSRALLGLPDDYRLAIVPASDTGAMEIALWNLLGPRGVDLLAWESFGADWVTDTVDQLRIDDSREHCRLVDVTDLCHFP